MVLIQYMYNAIHNFAAILFLAAILVFTAILIWYVIFDISWDDIYEIITHNWLLKKNTYLHSNICQNQLFWRLFCFSLISQNAQC